MSLDLLLEKDIAAFLDAELDRRSKPLPPRMEDSGAMQLNRDWVADIRAALQRKDVAQAKQLYQQLLQRYRYTPADHVEERRGLYTLMQECYVVLVNYFQEHHRTMTLLAHMENNPDDVFDVAIKPIDLRTVEHKERPVDYEPITLDNVQEHREHPLAKEQDIQLPPPPEDPALAEAHALTVGSTKRIASKDEQHVFVRDAKQVFAHALDIAQRSPAEARALVDKLEKDLETAGLGEKLEKIVQDKIGVIRAALTAYENKLAFTVRFERDCKELERLAREHDPTVHDTLHEARAAVEEFEKVHHVYHGHFSVKLDELAQRLRIFDEDDLVDAIKPLLVRIKETMRRRDVEGYLEALDGLATFTKTLPQSDERSLLEEAIETLRAKVHRPYAQQVTYGSK